MQSSMHLFRFALVCLCLASCESQEENPKETNPSQSVEVDLDVSSWNEYSEWEHWPAVKYPPSFRMEKPSLEPDGHKWSVKFYHPDDRFSFDISPRGWVDMYEGERLGVKTPEQLFIMQNLSNVTAIERHEKYTCYEQQFEGMTLYFYLPKTPRWGNTFCRLQFYYPKKDEQKYLKLMGTIKATYVPSFLKLPTNSE